MLKEIHKSGFGAEEVQERWQNHVDPLSKACFNICVGDSKPGCSVERGGGDLVRPV